jgi:hypothetical protein
MLQKWILLFVAGMRPVVALSCHGVGLDDVRSQRDEAEIICSF